MWVNFSGGEQATIWVVSYRLWRIVSYMMEDKLFDLGVVRCVTIMINTSSFVTCTTHDPPTTWDQNQLKAIFRTLIINVALNQADKPMRCNSLCFEVFTHIEVPHVASVHGSFITYKCLWDPLLCIRLLIQHHCAFLCIQSQLKVVTKVEAMAHILLNLLFDWCYLSNFVGWQVAIDSYQLNLIKLEYNLWVLLPDRQWFEHSTHLLTLSNHHQV